MMTREQYGDALLARAKVMKAAQTNPPVIHRWNGTIETPEWVAWMKYWKAIGARGAITIAETRQSWTVPTLYPWEFDIGYNG